jgi:predicted phage terminase large subunit-like protein
MREIRPQPKQEFCLRSGADIVIFGGGAGGGKTWTMFLECLRHVIKNIMFYAVFFRRTHKQIENPGGLWDASMQLFPLVGGIPRDRREWSWRGGGKILMSHLEHEKNMYDWQGSEVPLFIFDELTHFTRAMFFYMLSRNRSMGGVRPYIRATCNPDADSWVAEFIAWWIDQDTGYAIPERSGVIRWFVVLNDVTLWANSKRECIDAYGDPTLPDDHPNQVGPLSFTFVLSMLDDNAALMSKDPQYRNKLKAMSRVERERLLGGNWKIRPAPGLYFKREEVGKLLDARPLDVVRWVRYWDLAATPKTETNDPDWTAGVLMGQYEDGRYVVADCISERQTAANVRKIIKNTAAEDGPEVQIGLPQDPAQAGKDQAESLVLMLSGYNAGARRESGDKVTRAEPFAAQWQAGNVDVVRGHWNARFFAILESFPDPAAKKDEVDACSGAFSLLVSSGNIFDSL